LVAVRQGDWLQQGSAEGEAASRFAADGDDSNPQANAGAEAQLRNIGFRMLIF
jgi:hypothetical protein